MEPVLTTLAGWAVGKIADTVWQGAGDRLDKSLETRRT